MLKIITEIIYCKTYFSPHNFNSKMKTILTIGITTYFNTNLTKFEYLLNSLFSEGLTNLWDISKENFKNPQDENIKLLSKLINIYDSNNFIKELPKNIVEILVVIDNDGKHDKQIEEIIKIMKKVNDKVNKFCNIRYIISNYNIKVSCARNIIINEARGEYIVFTDDDDIRTNIKSLLNLIKYNKGYDYLGYYIVNSTYEELNKFKNKSEKIKSQNRPFISNISCYSAILRKKYYIEHNLYFTPNLSTEDVVWRSNLNYILNYYGGNIKQTQYCCYVHMEPSNNSLNNSVNNIHANDVRFLDDITLNNLSVLDKNNNYYYNLINMIMSQFIEIGFKLTDYRIFAITSSSSYYRGYNLIKHWLNYNTESIKSSDYDYQMTILCKKLTSDANLFMKLKEEDKQILIEYIPKYFSLPDLISISEEIDKFITLDIANDLLQYKFNYKFYEKQLSESKYLSEFIFRFICLMYLRGNIEYKDLIKNKIEILDKIMNLYQIEAEKTPKIEFYDYTHDYLLRRFGISNMYNYYNQDKVNDSPLMKMCYELYSKDKDLKTTTLGKFDKHFKGMTNVLVFYILSCNYPINKINELNLIKIKDYTGFDNIKSYSNVVTL